MGSFAGHIDEAIFFILIGSWWMLASFPRYIKSRWNKERYVCQLSYTVLFRGRRIPLESIFKTAFPFVGLMAEIISAKGQFLDDQGNFHSLVNIQHTTIYGLFVLHGIVDLLMSFGIPLPPGLDYLSAALCFFWYGLSFSFHAHMPGKEPLEQIVHVLPISVMYACALVMVLEIWKPGCFLLQLSRIFCVLMLGVWFFQVAFIIYSPSPFPGNFPNPRWNQTDPRNVHFMVALIGFHACSTVISIVSTFVVTWVMLKAYAGDRKYFQPLLQSEDDEKHAECDV